jgi:prepilin-type N-terminal cleavage/methylation domain-containing protein
MKKPGFTLIELLIVITLLGILAVAVLSAINPVEQINRSRDTSSRSDAEQLINATDRYYATKGYYPWMSGAGSQNTAAAWVEIDSEDVPVGLDGEQFLNKLASGGSAEIKESYVTRIVAANARHLFIYNNGEQGDSTYVCFNPRSASFREEAWNRCDLNAPAHGDYGDVPSDFPAEACATDCVGAGSAEAATGCFICLP